ncbi:hypothetical protein CK203_111481 [Vitis vinifera]|uniref:DUF4283 domain-containing protein n=1 Tax=Vitis vinifera TaxID=29760 RepID=A0A438CPP0_VITVI|nr:hypothetical protein CK203_111481 [Vitis vinifera]
MMKCKVERIVVEKKSFQVEFEGLNGGTWVSVTERSRGFVVSVGFGKEELDWLMEHLKKAMENCYKKETLLLVVPEGVKGNGWEDLRKAILSMQEYPDQVGGASKEKCGDIQMNKDIYRGGEKVQDWTHEGKAIARMMSMKGMVSINPISAFKGCFFVSSTRRAERDHDQGRLLVKGRPVLLRKWSPRKIWWFTENSEGLRCLRWKMGPGPIQVAVSVTGEDDKDDAVTSETTRSRNEWVKAGVASLSRQKLQKGYEVELGTMSATEGGFFPGHVIALKYKFGSQKGEWKGRSSLGPTMENFIGPSVPELSFKVQTERAQSGMRIRGLQAGPKLLKPTRLQRLRLLLPTSWFLCKGDRAALSRR